MRKTRLFSLLSVVLASITVAHATPATITRDSGPFYITGAIVKPKQHLVLNFDSLLPTYGDADYTITCTIQNDAYTKPYPIVLQMVLTSESSPARPATLNGHELNHDQGKLDQLINVLEVKNVHFTKFGDYIRTSKLEFVNLDDRDSAFIHYCVAKYSV